jgi:hypothetical protein
LTCWYNRAPKSKKLKSKIKSFFSFISTCRYMSSSPQPHVEY